MLANGCPKTGSGHLEGVLKQPTMNIYCDGKALQEAEQDLRRRAGSDDGASDACDSKFCSEYFRLTTRANCSRKVRKIEFRSWEGGDG